MDPSERAAALALGYGASQTVAAVLLTARVHQLTGSMGGRRALRLTSESLAAAVGSLVVMLWVAGLFDPTRRQALVAFLLGGSAGVAAFAALLALCRGREVLGRRRRTS